MKNASLFEKVFQETSLDRVLGDTIGFGFTSLNERLSQSKWVYSEIKKAAIIGLLPFLKSKNYLRIIDAHSKYPLVQFSINQRCFLEFQCLEHLR